MMMMIMMIWSWAKDSDYIHNIFDQQTFKREKSSRPKNSVR